MKKPLILLFLSFAIYLNSKATTYYLSTSGNDANNGTSTSTPWKTLNKLNSFFSSLQPGDNVLLNRGNVFYGSIKVNKSGSSGSPITIGAYGSGANPVVTGFTTVSSWTNLGSNIWESSNAVSTLATCNMVVIKGVNTPMGRYPNTGWLTYQSHSGTTSITSNQLSGSPNWTGAEIVVRIIRWILQRDKITGQSGGTLTFAGSGNSPTNGYGFFIQNDARTLDAQNEWYYNPSTKKIRIYSTTSPTSVQVSTIDELVLTSSANYITFDHIDFKGANSYLFENRTGKYITIQNCSLLYAGKIGLYINGNVSAGNIMTIDNNVFSDNNDNAMNLRSYSSYSWVKNNTIKNTGMIPGAGSNDQNSYDAIDIDGKNSIVEYNSITNSGHIAIAMRQSDGIIIRNNYISFFGMTKYDAGGIYSYNGDSTTVKSRIIDHNLVISSKLTSEGIGTDIPSCFGIYLDADSKNTSITNNTVAHCKDGIHILNSGTCTITNNVSYDNSIQFALLHAWNFGMKVTGMVVKNNIFFSKTKDQPTFSFRDDDNTLFNKFGTADYNYFARPIDDNSTIPTLVGTTSTNRTLAGWQSLSGQDPHSKKSPKSITDTSYLRFEYNATSSNKTISLPYTYIDVKGTSYNGSITLAPYTSAVLIRSGTTTTATANQPPTANAGADQTITLPTSSVSLSGSGTDPDGTISAYNWTEVSGPSTGTISSATTAATTVSALVQGIYKFQLRVTDNAGATDLDTVQVTVNAATTLLPAVNPANTVNGINYSYYESSVGYSAVPVFSTLTPVKTGTSTNFNISLANRTTLFAFHFAGYIKVPSDGQYTFYTTSDDGSNLYIDGVLVVNNDGIHAAHERFGTIGLKAGKHAISVGFFQQTGGSILTVSYSGPGISKQAIPASALFIVPGTLALNNNQTIISSNQVGIKVYPNPFADHIVINITGDAGNYSLMLVDVSGKILLTKSGIKTAGAFQQSVNTSTLQRGIYFLKVIQNNNSSVIKLEK